MDSGQSVWALAVGSRHDDGHDHPVVVFDIGGALEINRNLGVTDVSTLGLRRHRADRVRSRAASAMPHGDPEQQLRRCQRTRAATYGFEGLVDEIIYSHVRATSKPDPGIYTLTCERLQVEPARIAFLDDSEPCVEGARQAGIHAVL